MIIRILCRRVGILHTGNKREPVLICSRDIDALEDLSACIADRQVNICGFDRNANGTAVCFFQNQRILCRFASGPHLDGHAFLRFIDGKRAAARLRDVFTVGKKRIALCRGCQGQRDLFAEHLPGICPRALVKRLQCGGRAGFLRHAQLLQRRGTADGERIVLILRHALRVLRVGAVHDGIALHTDGRHAVHAAGSGFQRLFGLLRLRAARRGIDCGQLQLACIRKHTRVIRPERVERSGKAVVQNGGQFTRRLLLHGKLAAVKLRFGRG